MSNKTKQLRDHKLLAFIRSSFSQPERVRAICKAYGHSRFFRSWFYLWSVSLALILPGRLLLAVAVGIFCGFLGLQGLIDPETSGILLKRLELYSRSRRKRIKKVKILIWFQSFFCLRLSSPAPREKKFFQKSEWTKETNQHFCSLLRRRRRRCQSQSLNVLISPGRQKSSSLGARSSSTKRDGTDF